MSHSHPPKLRILSLAVALAAGAGNLLADETTSREAPGKFQIRRNPYYIIHSALDEVTTTQAEARLVSMAQEYRRRMRGFGGTIRKPLPVYLFKNREDYRQAGGMPGSIALYNSKVLMAVGLAGQNRRLWRVLQHEGFHQFAHRVIGGDWPPWLNEGLAEYFSLGIWTGDNYVTGVVPPERLRRLRSLIESDQLRPVTEMLKIARADWNAQMRKNDYDQAWSMVYFLIHAGGGEHQKAFSKYVNDIADGRPASLAFRRRFGNDVDGLEQEYKRWWMSLDENPTQDKYAQAVVETLTGFLARAFVEKQRFQSPKDFFAAARRGELKMNDQWLPPELLAEAVKGADELGRWSLHGGQSQPTLGLVRPDGARFTGTFQLGESGVEKVEVVRDEELSGQGSLKL